MKLLKSSLFSNAAQFTSKGERQQLASPHHLSTKGVESLEPTLSGLSTTHCAMKTAVPKSALSSLASQQSTTGGLLQPSLSTLATKHFNKEMASNSLSGSISAQMSNDIKFMTPAQITPTKVGPSLSSLAAEHSAGKLCRSSAKSHKFCS